MKRIHMPRLLALFVVLFLRGATAEDINLSSRPVGFNKIDCPAGSDTLVSNPFHRTPVFTGTVKTVSSSSSTLTIIPAGTNTFSAGHFTEAPHYLLFKNSGARAGQWFEITSNTSGTIVIEMTNGDLSGVGAGDPFDVIPHWTLGTLFPKESQDTLHLSTGLFPPDRKSTLLFCDTTTAGIDLAPNRIFFLTASGWHEAKKGFPPADEVAIQPAQSFVIRHPDGLDDTTYFAMNTVLRGDYETVLRTRKGGSQDNHLGIVRPLPVKLTDLDLTGFVDSGSNSIQDRRDEVRLFDPRETFANKEPNIIYFRVGGQWREDGGSSYPAANHVEIPPSTAIVIRKAATANGELQTWRNSPRYSP